MGDKVRPLIGRKGILALGVVLWTTTFSNDLSKALSGCHGSGPAIEKNDPIASQKDFDKMLERLLDSDVYIDIGRIDDLKHTTISTVKNEAQPDKIMGFKNRMQNEVIKNVAIMSANYGFQLKDLKHDIDIQDSIVQISVNPKNIGYYNKQFGKYSVESMEDYIPAIYNESDRRTINSSIDDNVQNFLIMNLENTIANQPEKNGVELTKKLIPLFSPIVLLANMLDKECIVTTEFDFESHELPEQMGFLHGTYSVIIDTNLDQFMKKGSKNMNTKVKIKTHFDLEGNIIDVKLTPVVKEIDD